MGSIHAPCPRTHPEAVGSRSRDGSSVLEGPPCPSVGNPGEPLSVISSPDRSPGASLHSSVPPPTHCLQVLTQLRQPRAGASIGKPVMPPMPQGAPGRRWKQAASPKGSSIPACSWTAFADGQRVCVCFPFKSWKTRKNPDRSMLFLFLFRQIFSVFPWKKYGVNSSPVL